MAIFGGGIILPPTGPSSASLFPQVMLLTRAECQISLHPAVHVLCVCTRAAWPGWTKAETAARSPFMTAHLKSTSASQPVLLYVPSPFTLPLSVMTSHLLSLQTPTPPSLSSLSAAALASYFTKKIGAIGRELPQTRSSSTAHLHLCSHAASFSGLSKSCLEPGSEPAAHPPHFLRAFTPESPCAFFCVLNANPPPPLFWIILPSAHKHAIIFHPIQNKTERKPSLDLTSCLQPVPTSPLFFAAKLEKVLSGSWVQFLASHSLGSVRIRPWLSLLFSRSPPTAKQLNQC